MSAYMYIYICIWVYKQAYLFGCGQPLTAPKKSPGVRQASFFLFLGAWGDVFRTVRA